MTEANFVTQGFTKYTFKLLCFLKMHTKTFLYCMLIPRGAEPSQAAVVSRLIHN